MKPFSSIIRNRRGAVCTLCVSLLLFMGTVLGTWSARCFLDGRLYDFPGGAVLMLGTLLGVKGWKDHVDLRTASEIPPVDTTPGA